ncbi:MAG: hypothetical protein ACLFPQ_00685 [Candidatus Woesearchaeota archaeon]
MSREENLGYSRALNAAMEYINTQYGGEVPAGSIRRRQMRKIKKLSSSFSDRFTDSRYENRRTNYHRHTLNEFNSGVHGILDEPKTQLENELDRFKRDEIEYPCTRNDGWLNIVRESNEGIKEFVRGLYEEASEYALRYMPSGSERRTRFQHTVSERIENLEALLDHDLDTLEDNITGIAQSKNEQLHRRAAELTERYNKAIHRPVTTRRSFWSRVKNIFRR